MSGRRSPTRKEDYRDQYEDRNYRRRDRSRDDHRKKSGEEVDYPDNLNNRERRRRDDSPNKDFSSSKSRQADSKYKDSEFSRRYRDQSRERSYKDTYDSDRRYDEKERSRRREHSPSRKKSKKSKKSKKKKSKKSARDTDSDSESEISEEEKARPDQSNGAYSNVDNPFNDINLGSKFRWGKKELKDKKSGLSKKEQIRKDMERREEARLELDKLNRRRQDREEEMEFREQEQMRMQREADLAQLGDWEAREDEFHLEQAKRRAEIRIRNRRAKPIDLLAINLKLAYEGEDNDEGDEGDGPLEISLDEPYLVFESLELSEVEDLKKDIQLYLALEKEEANQKFWTDMMLVCESKLSELRAAHLHLPSRIPLGVLQQIDSMLQNKTTEELDQLQHQVVNKLQSKEPIDTDYWEQNLKSITVWKAKARLRAHHEIVLSKRLEQLRTRQIEEAQQAREDLEVAMQFHQQADALETKPKETDSSLTIIYDPSMSPGPISSTLLTHSDRDLPILDPVEDWAQLLAQRQEVLSQKFTKNRNQRPATDKEVLPSEEVVASAQDFAARLFRQEREDFAAKATGEDLDIDEEIFDLEVHIDSQPLANKPEYHPRKPMYFNRVHTGYEWNKYNQTHYDGDNPPPKVVQGYKFHIFYPGLLKDPKTNRIPTPTFNLEPDPLSEDTQILRFSAGPPYQDIAFRVVKREWEYSHKKGFKSAFINHTLYLYFHFKRHYYRR